MTDQFNYVTCPKCNHDRNALTAKKCEICGKSLGKGASPLPLIGVGLAVLAIAGGGYLLKNKLSAASAPSTASAPAVAQAVASPGDSGQAVAATLGDVSTHLSQGEKILLANMSSPDKQAGVQAFAAGDFSTAITRLQAARQALRNDPETLIYLNNARLGKSPALTIAAVVPITSSTNAALELLRGVAQAQNAAIQAGVPFKVLIADDGNDPEQTKAIANTLVKDSSILAVIGSGTSRASLAAAPIYQQSQMVMIAPTSTSTELAKVPRGTDGNFIFRAIPSDQFTGTSLARYALSQGKNKAAVFYNSKSSYSKSLMDAFSTTMGLEGGQIVQQVDLSQSNASTQAPANGANVVVLLPDSETLKQAIEVAKANQNRLPLLGGDAVYKIESLQQGGSALNGMILSVPWHPLKSADPQFVKTASSLWGGDVNWRTALSYDALQAIRAARSAGNVKPQSGIQGRIALAKALGNPSFAAKGTTGAINFLPSGDRNSSVILVKIQPGSRSATGYDFVPLR